LIKDDKIINQRFILINGCNGVSSKLGFREIFEDVKKESVESCGEKIAPRIRELVKYENLINLLDEAIKYVVERAGDRDFEVTRELKNFSASGVAFSIVSSLAKTGGFLEASENLIEFITMYTLHTLLDEYRVVARMSMNPSEVPIIPKYSKLLEKLAEIHPSAVARGLARFVNSVGVEAEGKKIDILVEKNIAPVEINMPLYLREWLYEVAREMGRTPRDFIVEILHRYYDVWKIARESLSKQSE
jgi:hypothetical protein